MARVFYSNQVNEIIGSVGGLTFQPNFSGKIVRLRPINKNTSTKVVNDSKYFFSQLASLWNSLTVDEKFNWSDEISGVTTYNRYNEQRVRTGYNYFMSCNTGRLLLNLSPLETIGNYQAAILPGAFDLSVNSSGILIHFNSVPEDPNSYYFFYCSPPNRLAFQKQRSQFRLVQANVCNGTNNFNLTTAFESAYGLNWPIANISNAFKLAVAVCAFDIVHGSWSVFTFNTASYVHP